MKICKHTRSDGSPDVYKRRVWVEYRVKVTFGVGITEKIYSPANKKANFPKKMSQYHKNLKRIRKFHRNIKHLRFFSFFFQLKKNKHIVVLMLRITYI